MAKCPNCGGCLEFRYFDISNLGYKVLKKFECSFCKKYFIYVAGINKLIEVHKNGTKMETRK
jgi:hypothetical protein